MIFFNSVPVTDLGQQWMDDELPPDEWYFDDPIEGRVQRNMPDDLAERFQFLVTWIIQTSMWCQLYRQSKVAHKEFQFVVNYCERLADEMGFLVHPPYSGIAWPLPIWWCCWDASVSWDRWPNHLAERFEKAGLKENRTNPFDDERHPLYNDYKLWKDSVNARINPKRPTRITSSEGKEQPDQHLTVIQPINLSSGN